MQHMKLHDAHWMAALTCLSVNSVAAAAIMQWKLNRFGSSSIRVNICVCVCVCVSGQQSSGKNTCCCVISEVTAVKKQHAGCISQSGQ